MRLRITRNFQNPNDPKDDTSHREIKVLVVEASYDPSEKKRHTADLPAVNTRDQPPLALDPKDIPVTHRHYQPHQPKHGILPDVRYNAETGQGGWTDDAWAHRAICDLGEYHILHTLARDEWMHPGNRSLFRNWFTPLIFYGDIYILKRSKKSYDGSNVYGDTLPNATPKDEEDLIKEVGRLLDGKVISGFMRER